MRSVEPDVHASPAATEGRSRRGVLGALDAWYAQQLRRGVDASTPSHLIDRVVYSNFVYLTSLFVNVLMAASNAALGYWLLVVMNLWYHIAIVTATTLTDRHRYLAARVSYLIMISAGFSLESFSQGTAVHGERYFLMLAVVALGMFHSSERRYGVAAAGIFILEYLVLTLHGDALISIDLLRTHRSESDLVANEIGFTALFFASLVGLVNAYGRAIALVDEQRARAFESNRLSALGAMACNVAHEINTPLMAMDLHLDELSFNLSEDPAHTSNQGLVEKVTQLSHRIAAIVRGFKLVSHGGVTDPPSATTLGALVGAAVDLAAGRTKPLGVALTVSLPEPDAALQVEVVGVSQIILNLLGNAIDAVAELPLAERWIRIEGTAAGGVVALAVTDAGKIQDPTVRRRLFEAFYTTKSLGKGTGLGLSLSRQTAERHGGRLWFDEASPNTRFVLELPEALANDVTQEAA